MLKFKKTIYGSLPKYNELTKITAEIKEAVQKQEEEKINKTINHYAKFIQSIKKEYQTLAVENEIFKKSKKTWRWTVHYWLNKYHRKQRECFEWKRKRHYKKQVAYSESSSGDTESEYFVPKKRKNKEKNNNKIQKVLDNYDDCF